MKIGLVENTIRLVEKRLCKTLGVNRYSSRFTRVEKGLKILHVLLRRTRVRGNPELYYTTSEDDGNDAGGQPTDYTTINSDISSSGNISNNIDSIKSDIKTTASRKLTSASNLPLSTSAFVMSGNSSVPSYVFTERASFDAFSDAVGEKQRNEGPRGRGEEGILDEINRRSSSSRKQDFTTASQAQAKIRSRKLTSKKSRSKLNRRLGPYY